MRPNRGIMSSSEALPKSTKPKFLARFSSIVWVLAVVLAPNTIIAFEWTHPYCNNQDSGPAWSAFGFPLPYSEYSGISSLASVLMPHVLLLNIALLSALAYPFMAWAVRRLSAAGGLAGVLIAVPGALLLLLCTTILWLEFSSGFVVTSITNGYDHYWEYRPLGFTKGSSDCTPSEFWFGPIKNF